MMRQERVSIIIPTYNGKHLLKECLSSLYALNYPAKQFEIKLVDNNSTDGTAQYVRRHFRKVEVLHNPENNYCKANNLGIAHSRSPLLAFLNNDTAVDKNWLRALVETIHQDKRIGCVGSKVIFPDGRIQSTGHYEFPNFRWGDRGLREPDLGQYAKEEEVESLSGSSVLFRRLCLDDVGNFDEDFVMYLEDVDIFLRCRQKAWKLLYAPASLVRHAFHGTTDEKRIHFYIERNRLLLIAKHFPRELSRALETKEHSLTYEELYRILPDIFLKLYSLHKDDVLKSVLSDFCLSLQRAYNLSKDQAVQELNTMLHNAREEAEKIVRENSLLAGKTIQLEGDIRLKAAQTDSLSTQIKQVTEEAAIERSALRQRVAQLEKVFAEKSAAFDEAQAAFLSLQAKAEGMQVEIAHQAAVNQELASQRDDLQQQFSCRSQELAERSHQAEGLRLEIGVLQQRVEALQLELGHYQGLNQELSRQRRELEEQLSVRNTELKHRSQELAERSREAEFLRNDLNALQQKFEDIFHSRTYRFLAIPLWKIADTFRYFLRTQKRNILLIKPYYVSTEQVEDVLGEMRRLYKDAAITLFAHVFFPDYQRLKLNELADEKILFCPGTYPLTFFRLIKIVFRLNSRYFDQTILLTGMPIYQGYRKAKVLAFIIGGKRVNVYDVLEKKLKPFLRLVSFSRLNNELALLWGVVSFWFVVLFFLFFIVLPLKLKSHSRK
jgi:GT2 family glycosyltransferase